jgi:hypothetical protein
LISDGNLMIRMQVALVGEFGPAQFLQHYARRRQFKPALAMDSHNLGFPAAINAAPLIAHEAQHPKPLIPGVVSAFGPAATAGVVTAILISLVRGALASEGQLGAARFRAGAQDRLGQ